MIPGVQPILRGYRVAAKVIATFDERHLGLIAAGVAFYAMLAIFPAFAAVIALWGLVSDPAVIEEQLRLVADLVPADAYVILEGQIDSLIANQSSLGLASLISLFAAMWSARSGVAAIIRGLNAVYGAPTRRGLGSTIAAILMTFCLLGIALVALGCIVVFPIALAFVPLGASAGFIAELLRWIIVVGVVIIGLSLVYRFGPNLPADHVRTRFISPGSLSAILIWGVASWGFSYYLANFGTYNEVYGSIGAVIALLMWFFISAWVVLLGGVINYEIAQRQRGELQDRK